MSTILTARELATVLGALRCFQYDVQHMSGGQPDAGIEWAREAYPDQFAQHWPMSMEEIDQLCERLNQEATGEPDDPAHDIEKPEPEGSHKIKVYIPVCVEVRVHADGRLEAVRAAPDPEGSPFVCADVWPVWAPPDIDPEEDERAPLKCADNWEWRRGYEHELMAADDYVSGLLNQ